MSTRLAPKEQHLSMREKEHSIQASKSQTQVDKSCKHPQVSVTFSRFFNKSRETMDANVGQVHPKG